MYQLISIVQLLNPEVLTVVRNAMLTPALLYFLRTSIHRLAELFVQPMINTGAERERFQEIVQQVGDSLQYMDKVQVIDKEGNFEDVSHFNSNLTDNSN